MSAQQLSDSEIETLRKGATGAGMLVAVADQGFFDSFKEAGALAKHLAKARENTQSPLIRRLTEGRGTGFGLTSSPAEIESETLEALQQARQLLEKTPDELEAYRSFVVDIARSVSSAAGGGDEVEAQAVEKIESALGAATAR